MLRIATLEATGSYDHIGDAEIDADGRVRLRHRLFLLGAGETDEIAPRHILGERDRREGATVGEVAAPPHVQRAAHLRHAQGLAVARKGVGGEAGRLLAVLALDIGIARPAVEEVLKRLLQVAELLLKRDARHVGKPRVIFVTFQLGEPLGRVGVGGDLPSPQESLR